MIKLSDEQQQIKDLFVAGENVFISGAAGTGKTHLIRHLIEISNSKEPDLVVTATTGCAATLICNQARTINSWSGIGIATEQNDIIVEKISRNRNYRKAWKRCKVLFVDEISMLSKRIFDLLDSVGKKLRGNERPFGGIQLVFTGDFFQLPPVPDNAAKDSGSFCFKSENWVKTFGRNQFELSINFRQGEGVFHEMLSQIRSGKLSKQCQKNLLDRMEVQPPVDIQPIQIMPLRHKVDSINNSFNSKLATESHSFHTFIYDCDNNTYVDEAKHKTLIKYNTVLSYHDKNSEVTLKVGSQVMCTANIDMYSDKKICNGSSGKVVRFSNNGYPVVKFVNGRTLELLPRKINFEFMGSQYTHISMPLMLSWAITIHKAQGCSLDAALIDCGENIFECGQAYVALSRVRSLDGLFLRSFDVSKILIKRSVLNFYASLREMNTLRMK